MALNVSVRQKIVLSLWITTFLLLAVAGTSASIWFFQDQSRRLDDFLLREVQRVQDTFETYFSANDGEGPNVDTVTNPGFQSFLRKYLQDRLDRPLPYKTTLGIFGPNGNLVQSSNFALNLAFGSSTPPKEISLVTVPGPKSYRLATTPIEHAGRSLGTIRMACLTVTLAEVWDSFLVALLSVLVLVFLSFGLLGTWLIRWSLRPVRQMALSANEISESHLDRRLSVPAGQDEIAGMARTLNRLLERLERDFEFEEALVGQLSHELRTPLAILRGRNEVALARLSGPNIALKPVLEDNLADIDNVVSLMNTLLNLARLEGRLDPIRVVRCEVGELLHDLIDELQPLWDEKELKVQFEFTHPIPSVSADPILLRQVFLNLLTNAYKYTPPTGQIQISMELAPDHAQPTLRLEFWNSGPPIPDASLDLVFKRFYRVDVPNQDRGESEAGLSPPGFGLGLSIAQSLVELHHGSIRAFSPLMGGAAFEVCIPCETDEPRKKSKRSSS